MHNVNQPKTGALHFATRLQSVLRRIGRWTPRKPIRAGMILIAAASFAPVAAIAEAPPVCTGNNILEAWQEERPEVYQRIIASANEWKNSDALFWRIRGRNGVGDSYLFGTIHLTDERVVKLPAQVERALSDSRTLALEIVTGSDSAITGALESMRDRLFLSSEATLSDILTPDEMEALSKYLAQNGLPNEMHERMQPWFASIFLALSPCERRRVSLGLKTLDDTLEAMATTRGLKIVALERPAEQFDSMAGLNFEAQVAWLKTNIRTYAQFPDMIETLVAAYLDRRIAVTLALSREVAGGDAIAQRAVDEFRHQLISVRNHRMHQRALALLADGNAFIAVGALHLPGDDGLVELFRGSGYEVIAAE